MGRARDLHAAEQAVLDAVAQAGEAASIAEVVRAASAKQPGAQVREAYWKLLSEHRLSRSSSGQLRTKQATR